MTRIRLTAALTAILILVFLTTAALARPSVNTAREWLVKCYLSLPALDSEHRVYQDGTAQDFAEQVFAGTNEIRAEHKLRQLKRDPYLDAVAQAHAFDMARQGYFDHNSPQGMDVFDRMECAGCPDWWTGGENLAAGYSKPSVAIKAWMDSKGHRANVLNGNYDYMGVGVYYAPGTEFGWYWVQVYASYRRDPARHAWQAPSGRIH